MESASTSAARRTASARPSRGYTTYPRRRRTAPGPPPPSVRPRTPPRHESRCAYSQPTRPALARCSERLDRLLGVAVAERRRFRAGRAGASRRGPERRRSRRGDTRAERVGASAGQALARRPRATRQRLLGAKRLRGRLVLRARSLQPASFGLTPTGKECVQIDCKTSPDCCGNLPTEIPEKCRNRAAACTKTLPGCAATTCTRSSDCAGGGVCTGHCLVSSGECSGNADCLANKCLSGQCSINFTTCTSDADCTANTCNGGTCDCANPAYVPTLPVCTDPDCDGLCQWACEDSRCVIPTKCGSDDDCFGSKPRCVENECVECTDSADCSFEKICRAGNCETRCQDDTNCGLFEACQAGECINVGCRSDRECALIPDVNALQLAPGFDPRLLRCHTDAGVGKCVIPCDYFSQSAATETCSAGLCKYIGCENSDECKAILGVHDQMASDAQPWIPALDCRSVENRS